MTFSLLHPRSGKRTARLVRVQGLCAFMGYLAGCRFDGTGGYIDMVTPMGRARERDDLGILFALDPAIMPAQVCWPKTGTRRLRSSRDGGRGEASTLGTRFAMCVSCSGSPGQPPVPLANTLSVTIARYGFRIHVVTTRLIRADIGCRSFDTSYSRGYVSELIRCTFEGTTYRLAPRDRPGPPHHVHGIGPGLDCGRDVRRLSF
jgi:hypothetical protein